MRGLAPQYVWNLKAGRGWKDSEVTTTKREASRGSRLVCIKILASFQNQPGTSPFDAVGLSKEQCNRVVPIAGPILLFSR